MGLNIVFLFVDGRVVGSGMIFLLFYNDKVIESLRIVIRREVVFEG